MSVALINPLKALIEQLQWLLDNLTDEQYCKKIEILSNASIGQHTRHIVEFFLELNNGYKTYAVNYDARKRDPLIETDKGIAYFWLQDISDSLGKVNKPLLLKASFSLHEEASCSIVTNYRRELMYNLEHIVHHMALLRIGINAMSFIALPECFGVATSTIKYRNACAQ